VETDDLMEGKGIVFISVFLWSIVLFFMAHESHIVLS
jgi:hypothetical protein